MVDFGEVLKCFQEFRLKTLENLSRLLKASDNILKGGPDWVAREGPDVAVMLLEEVA